MDGIESTTETAMPLFFFNKLSKKDRRKCLITLGFVCFFAVATLYTRQQNLTTPSRLGKRNKLHIKYTTAPNSNSPPNAHLYSHTGKEANITLYISHKTIGGLGNKLLALVGHLALARVAGRHHRVAVTGKKGGPLIWDAFWKSNGKYIVHETPPEDKDVLWCKLEDLGNVDTECHEAFFYQPNRIIDLRTSKTSHGHVLQIIQDLPFFQERYWKAIDQDKYLHVDPNLRNKTPLTDRALFVLMELEKVLHKPTTHFQTVIQNFIINNNMTIAHDQSHYFDLALHVRKCVDCGWIMQEEQIQNNVQCALKEYQRLHFNQNNDPFSWEGTRIFLTSDSYDVVQWVQQVLPEKVHLVHNIPQKFIHTDKIELSNDTFDTLAMPYLDHYMMRKSRVLVSCFTSYAQTAALVTTRPSLDLLDRIIQTNHSSNFWKYDKTCLPLTKILFDPEPSS